jgi:hypothetical protein
MAQNPNQHAEDYGLSHSVAADLEPEEGPPLGGQHGETRTRVPEHAVSDAQGPKTRRKIRETLRAGGQGGTHRPG